MTIAMMQARGARLGLALFIGTSATIATAQSSPTVPPRPTPGPAKPFVFPKVATQTLPNGLRLAVIENHELPIVAVRIGFLGGTFLDAPGKEGGWSLMMTALREGTTMRSSTTIADAAADLGTTIAWPPQTPMNGAPQFTTIKSAWQPALGLVADMIMSPSFPVDAVARIQAAQANALARPAQGSMALQTLSSKLYGPDQPYTRAYYSTDSSVRRLTRDDIVALHDTYIQPQNTVIVVAGDVTVAEAEAAVGKAFSSWKRTDTLVDSKYLAPLPQSTPTTIYLRDYPGAQSYVISGQVIPNRGHTDAVALEAADVSLGGPSAGSRMYDAFRVSHGLSYSPISLIQWRPEPQAANWLETATVPAEKTDSAVIELVRVLRETHGERPLTQKDLDFSRRNLVDGLPAQIETVDNLAERALGLIKNGLPLTFYNDFVSRMSSLTVGELQAAAAKYIDSDHLVIVVVGDRSKIEAPLRATGIPVVIVDR